MKKRYPKTFDFLNHFRQVISARPDRKYYPEGSPFYTMRNVAGYTMAKWKVLWKHTGVQDSMRTFVAPKGLIPDQKVILVPTESCAEAHYVCACMNSTPVFSVIKNYIGLDASPHVLASVSIPQFDEADRNHGRLAELSYQCHAVAEKSGEDNIGELEAEINEVAARIWGITNAELKAIHKALADM